jgi:hypothetical protein
MQVAKFILAGLLLLLLLSSLVYTPHKQRGITRIDFGSDLV